MTRGGDNPDVKDRVALVIAKHQIHIVDSDSKQRAQLAFMLNGLGYRAHVYESLDELARFEGAEGVVLLNSDNEWVQLDAVLDNQLARGITAPIALYSSNPKPSAIVTAILGGAIDYLSWPIEDDRAFELLMERAEQFGKKINRRASARLAVEALSDREREVLAGMVAGLSNKAIGNELGISPRTVEIHRSNVFRKLEVDSSASAVRIGLYAGLDAWDSQPGGKLDLGEFAA